MFFDDYPEYSHLVSERIVPLTEKQALPNTTKLLFERKDKAIEQESQLVLLGSDKHETAGKLANLPDDVQFEGTEILIISCSDSDSQSDRTKTKQIVRPEGPGTEFLENRFITSMNSTYNTLFSHEALYSLQHASYLLFEISRRVDADNLKRIQSVLALCKAELPYGVIQPGTESIGPGELSEIVNANRRDVESFFGRPVDYYVLDVDVDGFGMETDLLTTLRSVDVATRRGIAASASRRGDSGRWESFAVRKGSVRSSHRRKANTEKIRYRSIQSDRFSEDTYSRKTASPHFRVESRTKDATAEIRRQIVRQFSPYNGGELFARMKAYIRNGNVNPRKKQQILTLIGELEQILSDASHEAWGTATEAFKSQVVAHTNKILHELITDTIHRWGVPDELVNVSISPRWTDGPDTELSVDLDVSVISSTGEVVFRLVIATSVFSSIGVLLGSIGGLPGSIIGGIIGGVIGAVVGYKTVSDTDHRNFKRHIDAEIRSALTAASQEMCFQFDKLTTSFFRQADDAFGEILTAVSQHVDDKLAEFKRVPSLSVDELDKKIRDQSQIYVELESVQQDMIALQSKLSSPEPG